MRHDLKDVSVRHFNPRDETRAGIVDIDRLGGVAWLMKDCEHWYVQGDGLGRPPRAYRYEVDR